LPELSRERERDRSLVPPLHTASATPVPNPAPDPWDCVRGPIQMASPSNRISHLVRIHLRRQPALWRV